MVTDVIEQDDPCEEMFEGFYCTLRVGHKGQHQAQGRGPHPYRVWGEPFIPERIEQGPTTYVGRVLFDEIIVEKEES